MKMKEKEKIIEFSETAYYVERNNNSNNSRNLNRNHESHKISNTFILRSKRKNDINQEFAIKEIITLEEWTDKNIRDKEKQKDWW